MVDHPVLCDEVVSGVVWGDSGLFKVYVKIYPLSFDHLSFDHVSFDHVSF